MVNFPEKKSKNGQAGEMPALPLPRPGKTGLGPPAGKNRAGAAVSRRRGPGAGLFLFALAPRPVIRGDDAGKQVPGQDAVEEHRKVLVRRGDPPAEGHPLFPHLREFA